MQIETFGNGVEVTPALHSYVEEKLTRVGKHLDRPCQVRVTMKLEKTQHHVDADFTLAGKVLHAKADGQTMYAAIDLLADKLNQQVVKHKEKQQQHAPGVPIGDNEG